MRVEDLACVARWLAEPHVARWWLPDTTAEVELAKLHSRIAGKCDQATKTLTIIERLGGSTAAASPVGWCQWYPYDYYPIETEALGADRSDCGIDYAIGEPTAIGRGLGTELIGALVNEVRQHRPGCGILADPDARNTASRRVLERNGFSLLAVRPVASELSDNPMAIYRLAGLDARHVSNH